MKIYLQYALLKTLEPTSGDRVSEIGLCLALCQFAEVYYSGQRFQPELPDYGLSEYEGEIPVTPADWYIIRGNKRVFAASPYDKRIWISSPYHQNAFCQSVMIGTFTDVWAEYLKEGRCLGSLNPIGERWPKAVSFRQAVLPHFKYSLNQDVIRRGMIGLLPPKVIGVFGRMTRTTYPTLLLQAFGRLKKDNYTLLLGLTTIDQGISLPKKKGIFYKSSPNRSMDRVYNYCDCVVVSQYGDEWEFCGNLKTLEPAACGCPVILQRSPAREESFGKDYPFYLEPGVLEGKDTKPLYDLIHKAAQATPEWRETLSQKVLARHGVKEAGEYLKQLLTQHT